MNSKPHLRYGSHSDADGSESKSDPNTRAAADHSDSSAARESGPTADVAGTGSDEARSALEAENKDLKDRLLRALAETENVRRRAERDLNDMKQYAISKFAGDVVGIADNIERAISSVPPDARRHDPSLQKLLEGIELTEREMQRTLEKHGIRKLRPEGERFDPNLHEALFEVPDPSVPSGTVKQVVESGYAIGSRALRPAKVGVSAGGPPPMPRS